jgi:hypothetical protein
MIQSRYSAFGNNNNNHEAIRKKSFKQTLTFERMVTAWALIRRWQNALRRYEARLKILKLAYLCLRDSGSRREFLHAKPFAYINHMILLPVAPTTRRFNRPEECSVSSYLCIS